MPTAKHWSTVASTVNTTLFPPSDEWNFAGTQSSWVHQAKQEGVAACHKPCHSQWSNKTEVNSISWTQIAVPSASAKKPKQTKEKPSGAQGNLESISAFSRVQSCVRDRFPKQRLRDKGGRIRVIFSLNGRKLLSSSTVRFTLSAEAVSCGRQIYFRTN